MNKKTKKILSTLGGGVMSIGAIASPLAINSSCSSSKLIDISNFNWFEGDSLNPLDVPSGFTNEDLTNLYFDAINKNNNLFINDLYYSLSQFLSNLFVPDNIVQSTKLTNLNVSQKIKSTEIQNELQIKKMKALISKFSIDLVFQTISFNLEIDSSFFIVSNMFEERSAINNIYDLKRNEDDENVSFDASFKLDVMFKNIPFFLFWQIDELNEYWSVINSLGIPVPHSVNAIEPKWSMDVKNYSLNLVDSLGAIQEIEYSNFILNRDQPIFPVEAQIQANQISAFHLASYTNIFKSAFLREIPAAN